MSTDQDGSKVEPVPKKAGQHRRATRRPRITADQAGNVTRSAYLLVRASDLVTKHETPIREWFHSLPGLAVKVVDAIGSWTF